MQNRFFLLFLLFLPNLMATAVYDDDGSMVVGCESKYMLYQTYVDIVLDKQKFDLDVSNEKILAVAHELLDRNKFDPFLRKKYKRRVSSILNNSTLLANEIPVNVDINLYPEIADGCALVRAGVQIPAEKQRDFKYVFFKKNWTKLKSNPIHAASLLIFYAAREHHLLSLEKDDPLEYTHSFLRHIYQNRWDVGALRTYVELFVPRNSFFSSKNTLASEYIVFNKLRIDPAVSIQKIPVNPENHIESQKQKYYLSSLTLFGRQQIEAYGKNYMAEKDVQYFSNGSVKRFYVKNLYAKYVEMFEQSDGQKFGFNNYISFHENGNLAGVNLVKTPDSIGLVVKTVAGATVTLRGNTPNTTNYTSFFPDGSLKRGLPSESGVFKNLGCEIRSHRNSYDIEFYPTGLIKNLALSAQQETICIVDGESVFKSNIVIEGHNRTSFHENNSLKELGLSENGQMEVKVYGDTVITVGHEKGRSIEFDKSGKLRSSVILKEDTQLHNKDMELKHYHRGWTLAFDNNGLVSWFRP